MNKLILSILLLGLAFKLFMTSGGNFFFLMDNGRDMVDIREMVVLGKPRLIGATSAIEGFYYGPAWYYLSSIPFILSGGDPYAPVVMLIFFWAIGGYFLLKLVSRWSRWLILPIGALWIASDYISLATRYAFNPNPVILLTPLFIYLVIKYLENNKGIFIALAFLLAGLFFNFELNFGFFIPIIIFLSLLIIKGKEFLQEKNFWIGLCFFFLTLVPQIFFDFRHDHIMTRSLMRFLSAGGDGKIDLFIRFQGVWNSFYNTFSAIMMNQKSLTTGLLILSIPLFRKYFSQHKKDPVAIIAFLYILVPFLSYLVIPVNINAWHLGGPMAASIILVGFIVWGLWEYNFFGKIFSLILTVLIFYFALGNILNYILVESKKPYSDPSIYRNEITAIDYVYKNAEGRNFKVYAYLPSVYDYPYQYLFWWYGQKKYGYIPGEYVYSRNKPQYIPSQEKFQGRKDNLSDLVFLIEEPDAIGLREAWEGDFKDLEFVSRQTLGSIDVQIKREIKK